MPEERDALSFFLVPGGRSRIYGMYTIAKESEMAKLTNEQTVQIALEHMLEKAPGLLPDGAKKLLRRAVEIANAVDVLNRWAAEQPGMRRWFTHPHVGGFVGCLLQQRTADRGWCSDSTGVWWIEFGDQNANDIPLAALRLAARAVTEGTLYNDELPAGARRP